MVINEKEFPVVVQAYQPGRDGELFVAEQMVRNQAEVDAFSSRYAGYIIEARVVKENELTAAKSNYDTRTRSTAVHRRGLPVWAILLLIVVVLVVVGFTTGWIQKTFELNL
jgi:type VI protein secretion system component VasF